VVGVDVSCGTLRSMRCRMARIDALSFHCQSEAADMLNFKENEKDRTENLDFLFFLFSGYRRTCTILPRVRYLRRNEPQAARMTSSVSVLVRLGRRAAVVLMGCNSWSIFLHTKLFRLYSVL
jgi:hypothetical protein